MQRDLQRLKDHGAEIIKHYERRDLTVGEFQQLLENFKRLESEQGTFDAVWVTIADAFHIGIAVGESIGRKRNKIGRKRNKKASA